MSSIPTSSPSTAADQLEHIPFSLGAALYPVLDGPPIPPPRRTTATSTTPVPSDGYFLQAPAFREVKGWEGTCSLPDTGYGCCLESNEEVL
ncbi:hypothetical protein PVAP13_5NG110339 [Panicum virgatum]|uniref:Uncharacterized protein n=1 Tax=Panicum virgatum TaxID=38727 RepID=A0A8T0S506_PANVG|nr:hypothetical protein PVAP13_5NG110339 [Panicum virgatum]